MSPRTEKARRIFQNLGVAGLARLAMRRGLRPWLLPGGRHTYTQFGEDACVDHLLGWSDTGFYVDVGCNDPRTDSVTFGLYERGWRGIAVDGNADFAAQFQRLRPMDCFVHALVSRTTEPVEFVQFQDSRLSSASAGHVEAWQGRSPVVSRTVMQPRSLASILEEHACPARFDLLNVDVEGHDLDALESNDFGRYRPALILVEVHGLLDSHPQDHDVVAFLRSHRYQLKTYTGFTAAFQSID